MMKQLACFFGVIFLFTTACVDFDSIEKLQKENHTLNKKLSRANGRLARLENRLDKLSGEKNATKSPCQEKAADNQKVTRDIRRAFREEIAKGDMEVRQIKEKLYITAAEKLFFDSGKAELSKQGQRALKKFANTIKKYPKKAIRIEGHTDSKPIGPNLKDEYPSNWELSAARAIAVVRFLQEKAYINPTRLSAMAKAQYQALATNKTARGRALNRRIEILMVDRCHETQ